MKIFSKIYYFILLTRINKPTGIFLLFFPAAFGCLLGYKYHQINDHTILVNNLLLFFIGGILARSAGCIINDIFDRNIDNQVLRTQNRPIASKKISVFEASIFAAILFCLALYILLQLTILSIVIGILSFFMILIYPLMKRITYFPQVFLGALYNLGVIIGYTSIANDIYYHTIILYIGCIFWTIAYDTIYAFMDVKYDKKIGVKSLAVLIMGKDYKFIIFLCYLVFWLFVMMSLLSISHLSKFIFVVCLMGIIFTNYLVYSMDVDDIDNLHYRFFYNIYPGVIIMTTLYLL